MCFAGKDRDVAALTRGDYSGDTLRQRPLSAVPIHARQQTMAKSAASPIPCLLALAVFLAFFPVLGTQADAENQRRTNSRGEGSPESTPQSAFRPLLSGYFPTQLYSRSEGQLRFCGKGRLYWRHRGWWVTLVIAADCRIHIASGWSIEGDIERVRMSSIHSLESIARCGRD